MIDYCWMIAKTRSDRRMPLSLENAKELAKPLATLIFAERAKAAGQVIDLAEAGRQIYKDRFDAAGHVLKRAAAAVQGDLEAWAAEQSGVAPQTLADTIRGRNQD